MNQPTVSNEALARIFNLLQAVSSGKAFDTKTKLIWTHWLEEATELRDEVLKVLDSDEPASAFLALNDKPGEEVKKYRYYESSKSMYPYQVIHTEGEIETVICKSDSAEKAHLITKALNQFKY